MTKTCDHPDLLKQPVLLANGPTNVAELPAQRYGMPEITKPEFLKCASQVESVFPRADPIAACSPRGEIYVAYQHPAVVVLHKSSDEGQTWQRVRVAEPPPFSSYGSVLAFGVARSGALILLYSGRPTNPP